MGLAAFVRIGVFASFAVSAQTKQNENPSPAQKQVQEIQNLRVLIGRIEDKDGSKLSIKGQALMSEQGELKGVKSLNCTRENPIASALLQLPPQASGNSPLKWSCYHSSQNALRVLGNLKIRDRSGFFQIQNKWYRGELELKDVGHSLLLINHVKISDYIAALLHGEMPKDYSLEALKAQAVAARSYAIATAAERRRAGADFDLLDTIHDQVYPGAQQETDIGNQATKETENQFLVFEQSVLKSFYHAASGGHSERPEAVWKNRPLPSFEAYEARPNIYDKGHYAWQIQLSSYMFESAFPSIGKLIDMRIHRKTNGHRVQAIELVGSNSNSVLELGSLRKLLSSISLKSLKFEITRDESTWKFMGEGWGHGVGLSQVAAQNMALQGKSYREILEHHYPKAQLIDVKPSSINVFAR